MIYFITEKGSHYVKIGYSEDPVKRLKELQTGNPRKLKILGILPGLFEAEKGYHEAFSKYRVQGEWFKNTGKLKSCIIVLTDPIYTKEITDLKSLLKSGMELEVRKRFNRYKRRGLKTKNSEKLIGAVSRLR